MSEYAVLLAPYTPLPHIMLGDEVAKITGVHRQDALIKLRKQQGIVWEHLERGSADRLGAYLIANGYPAGLVEQEEVVKLHRPVLCSNADPVEGGFELEDIFADKNLMNAESIEYMQAGWVDEEYEIGRERVLKAGKTYRSDLHASSLRSYRYTTVPKIETLGWVLHIFQYGEPVEWIRIISRSFNYDYQNMIGVHRDQRFGLLLADLARVVPMAALDEGFKAVMGSDCSDHEFHNYDTLEEMEERARWELTMRKLEM